MAYEYTTFYSDTGEVSSILTSLVPTTPFTGFDTQNRQHDYIVGNYPASLYYIDDPTNTKVPTLKQRLADVMSYSFSGSTHTWTGIPASTLIQVGWYNEAAPQLQPGDVSALVVERVDLIPTILPPPTIIDDGDVDIAFSVDGVYSVVFPNSFYVEWRELISVGQRQVLPVRESTETWGDVHVNRAFIVDVLTTDETYEGAENTNAITVQSTQVEEGYYDVGVIQRVVVVQQQVQESYENATHYTILEVQVYEQEEQYSIVDTYRAVIVSVNSQDVEETRGDVANVDLRSIDTIEVNENFEDITL